LSHARQSNPKPETNPKPNLIDGLALKAGRGHHANAPPEAECDNHARHALCGYSHCTGNGGIDSDVACIWITEKDVAARWGTSKYTVQRERKRGKLKMKKIGGRWKTREEWLREYEDQPDTPCHKNNSESEDFSLASVRTATSGAPATSISTVGRHDAHRLAQATFKKPKFG
jgi:hypothetical protein